MVSLVFSTKSAHLMVPTTLHSVSTESPMVSLVGTIKWADFVEKTKDTIGLETTCEMKSAVDCKKAKIQKCSSVDWQECRMEPEVVCENVFVHEPSQEKVHQKKCLTD